MSYKTEVFVDSNWCSNGLRFATEAEATEYGKELLSRWFAPSDSRAAPSDDPVSHQFDFNKYTASSID